MSAQSELMSKFLALKGGDNVKTTIRVPGVPVKATLEGKPTAATGQAVAALLKDRMGVKVSGVLTTEEGLEVPIVGTYTGATVATLFSDFLPTIAPKPRKAAADAAFDMAAKEAAK